MIVGRNRVFTFSIVLFAILLRCMRFFQLRKHFIVRHRRNHNMVTNRMLSMRSNEDLERVRWNAHSIALKFDNPMDVKKKSADAWRNIPMNDLFGYKANADIHSGLYKIDKDKLQRFGGSATVITVNAAFNEAASNLQELLSHNISLNFYQGKDEVPNDLLDILYDLPESTELVLRGMNDIIGSEFLAWHNLKHLASIISIDVPPNTNYNGSLEILQYFDNSCLIDDQSLSSRIILRIGDNSTFSFIQYMGENLDDANSGKRVTLMGHTTALLQPFSRLNHTFVQNIPDRMNGFELINASIGHASDYALSTVLIGGNTFRVNAHAELKEAYAGTEWKGIVVGQGKRCLDFRGEVLHHDQSTKSNQDYRIVLGDDCTAVYKSAILIPKIAQKSSALQVCKSILVNNPCFVHAAPVMRTIADDIICKHGLAVADLEEEELFYLLARGLPKLDARLLLIQDFLTEILPDFVRDNKLYKEKIVSIIKSFKQPTEFVAAT